jgi:hypothetical protein
LRQNTPSKKSVNFPKIKNAALFLLSKSALLTVVLLLGAFLVWQGQEMMELAGNKQGFFYALGLEFATMVAAAASALAPTRLGKWSGVAFVLALTAVMASFVVSVIPKRDTAASDRYKRVEEEKAMLLEGREALAAQLSGIPEDYKTRRAELQKRIEEKEAGILDSNRRLDLLQKEGGGSDLTTWANVASRILVMLLEAWMVHWIFVRRRGGYMNENEI